MGERHIQISEDITLVIFNDEDYVDIIQPNESLECGFEGVTITKDELVLILNKIEEHKNYF